MILCAGDPVTHISRTDVGVVVSHDFDTDEVRVVFADGVSTYLIEHLKVWRRLDA